MMKQKKIMIPSVAEAKDFVFRASECDFTTALSLTQSRFLAF